MSEESAQASSVPADSGDAVVLAAAEKLLPASDNVPVQRRRSWRRRRDSTTPTDQTAGSRDFAGTADEAEVLASAGATFRDQVIPDRDFDLTLPGDEDADAAVLEATRRMVHEGMTDQDFVRAVADLDTPSVADLSVDDEERLDAIVLSRAAQAVDDAEGTTEALPPGRRKRQRQPVRRREEPMPADPGGPSEQDDIDDLGSVRRRAVEKAATELAEAASRAAAEQEAVALAASQRASVESAATERAAEAERAAAERVAAERAAAEQAERARVAAEQRAVTEQAAAERATASHQAAEMARRAYEERVAAERAATEQADHARRASEERAAAERQAADEAAAHRAAANARLVAEESAARQAAEAEQASRLRAEAERAAAAQAEIARLAAEERATAERAAAALAAEAEAAAAARLAAEREAARLIAEQDSAARAAATERSNAQRLAAEERAEAERSAAALALEVKVATAERLAAERAAAAQAEEARRAAADRVAAERTAAAHAEAQREALAARIEAENAAAERSAVERESEKPERTEFASDDPVVPEPEIAATPVTGEQPSVRRSAPAAVRTTPAGEAVDVGRTAGSRSISVLFTLVLLVITAAACYLAWLERTPVTFGVAAVLSVVTYALAARSTGGGSHATVTNRVLDIRSGESRHRFDLGDPRLKVEAQGSPRDRRWKVLVHRRGMSPFVIDGSIVDPVRFMQVFEESREGL